MLTTNFFLQEPAFPVVSRADSMFESIFANTNKKCHTWQNLSPACVCNRSICTKYNYFRISDESNNVQCPFV